MLIPPYYDPYDDDYGDDEFGWHNFAPSGPTKDAGLSAEEDPEPEPKKELIEYPEPDHLGIQLLCNICNKHHRTNVRGDIPNGNIAPCYKCWWMFYVSPEVKTQDPPKTESVKPPSPVKEDDSYMDELAHNWFGFGL